MLGRDELRLPDGKEIEGLNLIREWVRAGKKMRREEPQNLGRLLSTLRWSLLGFQQPLGSSNLSINFSVLETFASEPGHRVEQHFSEPLSAGA